MLNAQGQSTQIFLPRMEASYCLLELFKPFLFEAITVKCQSQQAHMMDLYQTSVS